MEYRRDAAGNVEWYLLDGLGSVVATVDSSGNVLDTRKYDVYGAVRSGGAGTRHRFVGQLGHTSDDEIGLSYMRARYYDPVLGRFVGEDPGRHGANWFVYAASSSTNRADRTGREDYSLNSIAVGADGALSIEGAGNLGIEVLEAEFAQTGDQGAIFIHYLQAATGTTLRMRSALGMLKSWAQGRGIVALYIGGVAGSDKGARAFQAALTIINRMGDAGELLHNGVESWIYWCFQ